MVFDARSLNNVQDERFTVQKILNSLAQPDVSPKIGLTENHIMELSGVSRERVSHYCKVSQNIKEKGILQRTKLIKNISRKGNPRYIITQKGIDWLKKNEVAQIVKETTNIEKIENVNVDGIKTTASVFSNGNVPQNIIGEIKNACVGLQFNNPWNSGSVIVQIKIEKKIKDL